MLSFHLRLAGRSRRLESSPTDLQTTFSAENVGGTIARAFEAGGSLMDAMKSIGAQMATNLGSFFSSTLSAIPIVGPFLGQFGGLMVAGLTKLGGKIWGGIKSIFGGPDGIEMEGREAATDARNAIADTLTDGQIAEAAGNMADAVHIAVRDATLGTGGTIEMAERTATEMVTLLHTAEKQGVGAVAAAQAAIEEILGQNSTATEDATENFAAFFNEVSLEQAPAFTEAMIEAFGRAQVAVEAYPGASQGNPSKYHVHHNDRASRRVREQRAVVRRVPAVADRSESCRRLAAGDPGDGRGAEGRGDRRHADQCPQASGAPRNRVE